MLDRIRTPISTNSRAIVALAFAATVASPGAFAQQPVRVPANVPTYATTPMMPTAPSAVFATAPVAGTTPAYTYAAPVAYATQPAAPVYSYPAPTYTYANPATTVAATAYQYAAPMVTQAAAYTYGAVGGGDPYGFTAWLNGVRAQHGLRPVTFDPSLAGWAAANNSQQAARGLGHFVMGPARRQNSAVGSAASIGSQWMNSPAHRAAMLDPSVTTIGLAGNGSYWTLNLR